MKQVILPINETKKESSLNSLHRGKKIFDCTRFLLHFEDKTIPSYIRSVKLCQHTKTSSVHTVKIFLFPVHEKGIRIRLSLHSFPQVLPHTLVYSYKRRAGKITLLHPTQDSQFPLHKRKKENICLPSIPRPKSGSHPPSSTTRHSLRSHGSQGAKTFP